MEISTIGFTKKSASAFFGTLKEAGIQRLIDVRLHNVSQLAGFSKKDDLAFFLREICDADYVHEPLLAPTPELLAAYQKGTLKWPDFAQEFVALMTERHIEDRISPTLFALPTVLLCGEPTADHCHRRLVAEYLQSHWGDVTIRHL